MDYTHITVSAALIGAFISMLIQAIKLLPAAWLQDIFGRDEKTQSLRMRAMVFILVLFSVISTASHDGMFTWGEWYNMAYMLIVSLTASYTTYQTVLTMIADKYPEYFTLSVQSTNINEQV